MVPPLSEIVWSGAAGAPFRNAVEPQAEARTAEVRTAVSRRDFNITRSLAAAAARGQ
jgi:hypothetical protein